MLKTEFQCSNNAASDVSISIRMPCSPLPPQAAVRKNLQASLSTLQVIQRFRRCRSSSALEGAGHPARGYPASQYQPVHHFVAIFSSKNVSRSLLLCSTRLKLQFNTGGAASRPRCDRSCMRTLQFDAAHSISRPSRIHPHSKTHVLIAILP
jgi:hypothetical protein